MKTLTVHITDPSTGKELAWVRMSSRRQFEVVLPESGGPKADALNLPSKPFDIVTLGCIASAAASEAGLANHLEWQGLWDFEPSTPEDRESEDPDEEL